MFVCVQVANVPGAIKLSPKGRGKHKWFQTLDLPAEVYEAIAPAVRQYKAKGKKPLRGSRILVLTPHLTKLADDIWEGIRQRAGLPDHRRDGNPPYVILRGPPLEKEEDTGLTPHTDIMDMPAGDQRENVFTVLVCLTDIDTATGAVRIWPTARMEDVDRVQKGTFEGPFHDLVGLSGKCFVFNSLLVHEPLMATDYKGQTLQFLVTKAKVGKLSIEPDLAWLQSDEAGVVRRIVPRTSRKRGASSGDDQEEGGIEDADDDADEDEVDEDDEGDGDNEGGDCEVGDEEDEGDEDDEGDEGDEGDEEEEEGVDEEEKEQERILNRHLSIWADEQRRRLTDTQLAKTFFGPRHLARGLELMGQIRHVERKMLEFLMKLGEIFLEVRRMMSTQRFQEFCKVLGRTPRMVSYAMRFAKLHHQDWKVSSTCTHMHT